LFKSVKDKLLEVKPILQDNYRTRLETSQNKIGDIHSFLESDIAKISKQIEEDFPEVKKIGLRNFTVRRKEERFLNIVNNVFNRKNIITLFKNIYPRNDKEVRRLIREWYQEYEASIPALFEYLLGIAFYLLSGKRINISDIINSNIDSNLLPKTSAPGKRADLVFNFQEKDYLIEATLSENDGQRKMEAEPVPRHLAKHIIEINPNSLAIFIAGKLDPNNLVILRNYRYSPWYGADNVYVERMDILPLTISNLLYLLETEEKDFDTLIKKFEILLNSETKDGFMWYQNEVNKEFSHGIK
jgi:hypothetical protein